MHLYRIASVLSNSKGFEESGLAVVALCVLLSGSMLLVYVSVLRPFKSVAHISSLSEAL